MNKPGNEEAGRHHKWAHLPAGPWVFTGVTENTHSPAPGVPAKPGGCCDHCSTGIRYEYWFQAPCGERFNVGSTCVHKMLKDMGRDPDAGLSAAMKAIKATKNKAAAERRKAKNAERRAASADARKALCARLDVIIEAKRENASSLPHPLAWQAEQGATLVDWAEWMRTNGDPTAWHKVIDRLELVT